MEKVILLNSSKTKSGKTAISYAYSNPKNTYRKGFDVLTQYLEIPDLHDKFGISDFGKTYEAEFGYVDTYDGQARKIITMLADEKGELIFEL